MDIFADFHRRTSAILAGMAARGALPDLDSALAEGNLGLLLGWLRAQVHARGSLLGFNDLLRAATGAPLDPADFTAHLTARYLA